MGFALVHIDRGPLWLIMLTVSGDEVRTVPVADRLNGTDKICVLNETIADQEPEPNYKRNFLVS